MKKITGILLTAILLTMLAWNAQGFCDNSKHTLESLDLFGIRFNRPSDWNMEVRADYVSFTSPQSQDIQLILLDVGKTDGNLDQFLNDYKDPAKNRSLDEFKLKFISSKPIEVDGLGAYYLRFKSDRKEFGHVLFLRNNHQYILAFKAPTAEYQKNETVLLKAVESLKFYKVK